MIKVILVLLILLLTSVDRTASLFTKHAGFKRTSSRSRCGGSHPNNISYKSISSLSGPFNPNPNLVLRDSNLPELGEEVNTLKKSIGPIAFLAVAGSAFYYSQTHDMNALLESTLTMIEGMGPLGYLYFGLLYILFDVLAIPAVALTASSGYLFGLVNGTVMVLTCATIAATVSFFIGRTFLRGWASKIISESDRWRVVDKAIGKEGFKVILLLRLSPLLPFALSNYLYGVTSVDFVSYITATFLGFAPGSFGVVYFGSAGKALTETSSAGVPWYGYAGVGVGILLFGQAIAKYATSVIQQMEEEDKEEQREGEDKEEQSDKEVIQANTVNSKKES